MTWFSTRTMPSYETIISTAASLAASIIVLRNMANVIIPDSIKDQFFVRLRKISTSLSSQLTVVIEEFDGFNPNRMFHSADIYLGEKLSSSARRIKVKKLEKGKDFQLTTDKNQELVDVFQGVKLTWVLFSTQKLVPYNKRFVEALYYELSFHKKHREMVLNSYLPYILQKGNEIREEKKRLKIHTIDYQGANYWSSVNLDHPATFETLAMEPEMKKELIQDLDMFLRRKEFYRTVGKAWKRGYLLYGPPGTGKSSLVAAMANHLKFDVYDLELQVIQSDADLRRILFGTGSRSIIVIEDIDIPLNSAERAKQHKVTLSCLLNFIDGLWSTCGDERIIVFTTNHKDRIDPVLLRPGRMDMHLHMSYCTFCGFKTLALNYLHVEDHPLFEEIKGVLEKVEATPAEIAGELMRSGDQDVALHGLMKFLHDKAIAVKQQQS